MAVDFYFCPENTPVARYKEEFGDIGSTFKSIEEYLEGDFWCDPDRITLSNGRTYAWVRLNDMVLVRADTSEDDTDLLMKLLSSFIDDNAEWSNAGSAVSSPFATFDAVDENALVGKATIHYRGGVGYAYAVWVLNT